MSTELKYFIKEIDANRALRNWANFKFDKFSSLVYVAVIKSTLPGFNFELEFGYKTFTGTIRAGNYQEITKQVLSQDSHFRHDSSGESFTVMNVERFSQLKGMPIDGAPNEYIANPSQKQIKYTNVFIDDINNIPERLPSDGPVYGVSICHRKLDMGGSLGGFFSLKNKKGIFGISNWHVLKGKGGFLGDDIFSPRLAGLQAEEIEIAQSRKLGRLVWGKVNQQIDAAVFQVTQEDRLGESVTHPFHINGLGQAEIDAEVWKIGFSSPHKKGQVRSRNTSIRLRVPGIGSFVFHNQIQTTKISEGGDSGSFLMNDNNQVVGLLFASHGSNDGYSYANDINNIFNKKFDKEHFYKDINQDDKIELLEELALNKFIN